MKNSKMLYRNIQVFIDHKLSHPVIVAPTHIAELRDISHIDKDVKFGASVTLTRIDEELKDAIQKYLGIYRSQYVPPSDCCTYIVTCMLFICFLYFVYLVSADPDIGDIDGK